MTIHHLSLAILIDHYTIKKSVILGLLDNPLDMLANTGEEFLECPGGAALLRNHLDLARGPSALGITR